MPESVCYSGTNKSLPCFQTTDSSENTGGSDVRRLTGIEATTIAASGTIRTSTVETVDCAWFGAVVGPTTRAEIVVARSLAVVSMTVPPSERKALVTNLYAQLMRECTLSQAAANSQTSMHKPWKTMLTPEKQKVYLVEKGRTGYVSTHISAHTISIFTLAM